MLEFIDVISNDLPSYKKTKKAKVKAAKHSLRFQTKRQMERELIQDYDDTRQLMWEEIYRDLDKDYNYNPWDDQYGMDDYYWWVPYHRFEDARYDEVYDYRNGYDYDYISSWQDDLYAELGLNDKL